METHKSLTDQIQSLIDYSFALANAHVKVKIEPVKSHRIFNLSSITVAFFTAGNSCWTFVEHLILVRPCDQLSYTFKGSVHNNRPWSGIILLCICFNLVPGSFKASYHTPLPLPSGSVPAFGASAICLRSPHLIIRDLLLPHTELLEDLCFLPHPKLIFQKTLLIMDCELPKARFDLSSLWSLL